MRRVGFALALILVVATGAAALAAWSVPETTVRAVVARQILAATGIEPRIAGHARFTLLPVPGIAVDALSLPSAAPHAWGFQADGLEATLRLAPLLVGRLELASVSLRRPRLVMTISPASAPLPGTAHPATAQPPVTLAALLAAGLAAGTDILPASIRMVEGQLVLRRAGGGEDIVGIDDAALSSSAFGVGAQASGVLSWRGQTIDASLAVADPGALLAGGRSDVRVKAECDLAKLTLAGAWGADGRFEGTLGAKAPSLAALLRWAGLPVSEGHSLGVISLQSPASVAADAASLSDVQLEVDGNALEGALLLQPGPVRLRMSGTLASERFDATDFARDLIAAADAGRDWRAEPLQLDGLALADLDLRLSAAEARVSGLRLAHVAAAITTRDGVAELSLGDAAVYGGTLKGRIGLAPAPSADHRTGARLEANLVAEAVDVGPAFLDLLGNRRLEGRASGRIDVAATGDSVDALMHGVGGRADLSVADGAVVGIDLADAARRVQRRPLSAMVDQTGGRTPFDILAAAFVIEHGVASTTDARLTGPLITVGLGGQVAIGERRVDLAALAALPATDDGLAYRLPFRWSGSWTHPSLSMDVDNLIRQSGAAAPLLGGFKALTAAGAAVGRPAAALPEADASAFPMAGAPTLTP